jgi:hypothetical protein
MRKRPWAALGALALASGPAGCGGDEQPAESVADAPSAEPSATPPEPVYVETETCREEMRPLIEVMLANDTDNLGFGTFSDRFQRVQDEVDDALTACSSKVAKHTRMAVYEYATANAFWTPCDNGTVVGKCDYDAITESVIAGNQAAAKAEEALAVTE